MSGGGGCESGGKPGGCGACSIPHRFDDQLDERNGPEGRGPSFRGRSR